MCVKADFPEMVTKLNLDLDRKSNHKKTFCYLDYIVLSKWHLSSSKENDSKDKRDNKVTEEVEVQGLAIRVQQGHKKEKTLCESLGNLTEGTHNQDGLLWFTNGNHKSPFLHMSELYIEIIKYLPYFLKSFSLL